MIDPKPPVHGTAGALFNADATLLDSAMAGREAAPAFQAIFGRGVLVS